MLRVHRSGWVLVSEEDHDHFVIDALMVPITGIRDPVLQPSTDASSMDSCGSV
jgi:hypothetical protein